MGARLLGVTQRLLAPKLVYVEQDTLFYFLNRYLVSVLDKAFPDVL